MSATIRVERVLELTVDDVVLALREAGYDLPVAVTLVTPDGTRAGGDKIGFRWNRTESATRAMAAKEPTP